MRESSCVSLQLWDSASVVMSVSGDLWRVRGIDVLVKVLGLYSHLQ